MYMGKIWLVFHRRITEEFRLEAQSNNLFIYKTLTSYFIQCCSFYRLNKRWSECMMLQGKILLLSLANCSSEKAISSIPITNNDKVTFFPDLFDLVWIRTCGPMNKEKALYHCDTKHVIIQLFNVLTLLGLRGRLIAYLNLP